ncbi:DUF4340 domain-containing protein [Beggiatoa leptomitoformis]|uniref:DUF4340 domain-containing protein n=1 Tax=Beggiatoa leptomitoformis TaxID=288004 RepID=A0A2N9YA35_9GAMM|nr:DUF4340 domain-containing protein [Beggiatoa leptomitoformis]ALG67251.1 DUF4340 domain-containing protein [Beggiatoa leptomitoformis]AUI67326.1 DUF4340 domain-containing protein [Beggiatoa leptomitoformis]
MNIKSLSILAILTILAIFFAVQLTQKPQSPTTATNPITIFPNLMSVINEVSEIDVKAADQTTTLSRSTDGLWGLKEKSNYPADLTKVRNILMGFSNLKVLEAKTSNPEWYEKIGVEDVSTPSAKSTLITLKKPDGTGVASLIIGNNQRAKADSSQQEIFVRKPEDKQSWLVQGSLPVEKTALAWISNELTDIAMQRIQAVDVTQPSGKTIQISKTSATDETYKVADLPENAKVSQPDAVNQIATTLSNLTLEDVIASSELKGDEKAGVTAVFKTFDGLTVTLKTVEKDSKQYGQFTIAFTAPQVAEKVEDKGENAEKAADKPDPIKVTQAEAEKLQQTLTGWAYVIPASKMEALLKPQADFITTEPPQAAATDAIGEPSTVTTPLLPLLK